MFKGIELTGFSISPSVQKMILLEFVLYSLLIIGFGAYLKAVQKSEKTSKFADFLTGGGGLNAVEVALLTAMTLMGGGTMVSAPGLAYRDGFIYTLVNFAYFISNWVGFTVYGKRMAILGRRIHAQTCVQMIHFRFQSRIVAIVISVGFALSFTINCGGQLLNAAKLFSTILGADLFHVGLVLTGVVIFLYTISGGIRSLAKICVLQGFLMIVAVLSLAFVEYRGIADAYGSTQAAMEFITRSNAALVNARNYTPLYFVGMVLVSSWGNANSLAVLQSALTFDKTKTLRRSLMMSCGIIMLIQLIMASSGPLVYALNQNITNADYSTMYLVTNRLPSWMAGIAIAAIFAAIQSSIASFLLAIAGTIVRDMYKDCINEKAGDQQMNRLNYIVLAAVVVVSLIIAMNQESLGQEILILAGGIAVSMQTVPLLIGTFWKRATAGGALCSGILGIMTYGVASFSGSSAWYQRIFFGAHAIIPTILVAVIAMIVGSLLTPQLKVPLGVYKVWFCKDYDEKYTTVYNSLGKK